MGIIINTPKKSTEKERINHFLATVADEYCVSVEALNTTIAIGRAVGVALPFEVVIGYAKEAAALGM
ncbi:MAG: hypothetical protein RBT11_19690 [Desulfobacterales bacterium]|jgi:hypothetical protein|nr:hypothetical protein [Desulfobacterales bacterium]